MGTDREKARNIYDILFLSEKRTGDIPSFGELASLVSRGSSVFSSWFKTGKKKLKIGVEVSFPHQNEEDNTMDFNLSLFLIVAALAAAGVYTFVRKTRSKDSGTSFKHESPPPNRTSSQTQMPPSPPPPPDKYLLLAFDMNKLPECAKGGTFIVKDGRTELFDAFPSLLARQTKDEMSRIEQSASAVKPVTGGYTILSIPLPADAMAKFQEKSGTSEQRDAFEKLTGKSLKVLGFMESLSNQFYNIG
jgi:hypothetical protein